jgi:hypothetical protein
MCEKQDHFQLKFLIWVTNLKSPFHIKNIYFVLKSLKIKQLTVL